MKSFSKVEMEKFHEFITSPYFNKALYLRNFYDKVKEYCPEFENYEMNKENIFRALYPGRNYNDSTVRKLNSELLRLAEEFITINSLKENQLRKTNLLLEELNIRGIDNLFIKKLNSAYSSLETECKSEEYYKELLFLNDIDFSFYSMRNRAKGFPSYINSIDTLDKLYTIQKLRKIIVLVDENRNITQQKKVVEKKKEIEDFIDHIRKVKMFRLPVIQILYYILMMSWKGEKTDFDTLKELVEKNKAEVSSELEWIYFSMINYCIIQGNAGKKEFAAEELQLYRHFVKSNFHLYNNTIESVFFKNIISCAAEAGDLEFAREFKEKNAQYLIGIDKIEILPYCEAIIQYAEKNYSNALELLAKINFSNVNLKLGLRSLTLKIFYENEMYEQASFNVDSYQQNLKREKTIPPDILRLYTSFIKLYKKLLKIKLSPDKTEADMLKELIMKTETVAKAWFLTQCDNL